VGGDGIITVTLLSVDPLNKVLGPRYFKGILRVGDRKKEEVV
jgi:hypothetical protein